MPHFSTAWVLFYLPPSILHSMNSLDENTVNAPADDNFEIEVSVQKAASAWQLRVLTEHPAPPSLCCGPQGLMDPLCPLLCTPQQREKEGWVSVPIPSDHTLLLQQVKMQPTDPTDKEALVAALDMKEPTRTAYLNSTFTTTDL